MLAQDWSLFSHFLYYFVQNFPTLLSTDQHFIADPSIKNLSNLKNLRVGNMKKLLALSLPIQIEITSFILEGEVQ